MRRVVVGVLLMLLVAGLLWLVMGGAGRPAGTSGVPDTPGAAAQDAEGDGEATADERRARARAAAAATPERARIARPAGTAYQSRYPEIGQDVEQDPDLGAFSGTVLIAQSQPAAGAVVTARRGSQPVARVFVESDGRFLMRNVRPGVGLQVEAHADGYAPGGFDRVVAVAGETTELGTVYVGAAIDASVDNRLRVVCRDTAGEPVPGAEVTATSIYYGALLSLGSWEKVPGGTVVRATSDAEGEAVFERLPPAAYDVLAVAEGHAMAVRERVTVQSTTRMRIDLDLAPGLEIRGTIVDEEGNPLADARIGGMRWGNFEAVASANSDAEGRFALTGLSGGAHMVFIAKEGVGGIDLQRVNAGTTDLEVTVPTGGVVRVAVTDKETGEPITAFGLRPYRKVPFAYLFSPLLEFQEDDGVATLTMPASDYGVEVSAPGYSLVDLTSVRITAPEPVAEGEEAPEPPRHDVQLERAGVVRGRVVSKLTGQPVSGAEVYVEKGGFPPSRVKDLATATDKDGLFVLDKLPPRQLSLRVSHVDHTSAMFDGVEPAAAAKDGTLPPPQDFALGTGGRIVGRVLDDGHVPLTGQSMELTSGFDLFARRTAMTDDDGRYEFRNVPTDKTYSVSVGRFLPGQTGRSKSGVRVSEGGTLTVDFGTETGGRRLEGRVTRDETPLSGVSVSLVSEDGGSEMVQSRTDSAGVFVFESVAPGRYQVNASSGGQRSVSVTVPAEGDVPVVEIAMATAVARGTVTSGGAPVAGCYVECELVVAAGSSNLATITKRWRGNSITGDDGTFRVNGLEDGEYRIRAYREGLGAEVKDVVVTGGQDPAAVEFELGAAGTVTGFVRTSAGVPVAAAQLTVRDSDGRNLFLLGLTTSSSDGSYVQGTLPTGTFTLEFSKEGYAPSTKQVDVVSGNETNLDFVMLQGGAVDVVALDEAGTPVKNAIVQLLDSAGNVVERSISVSSIFSTEANKTDEFGQCALSGVAPGTYTVRVRRGKAKRTSDPFEVLEGGRTRAEVTMPVPSGG